MSKKPAKNDNLLLNALSAEVRERIDPQLILTDLPLGDVLYESGDVMNDVYFPRTPSYRCCM